MRADFQPSNTMLSLQTHTHDVFLTGAFTSALHQKGLYHLAKPKFALQGFVLTCKFFQVLSLG